MAKYYGSYTSLNYNQFQYLKDNHGYDGSHNQFIIVCKANSKAEANRIAEDYKLGKVFNSKQASETRNPKAMELADKYGLIIAADGTYGRNYIDFKELTAK